MGSSLLTRLRARVDAALIAGLALLLATVLAAGATLSLTAAEAKKAGPKLSVDPKSLAPGEALTAEGERFKPGKKVTFKLGPKGGKLNRAGKAKANRKGKFKKDVAVPAGAAPGPYKLVACQKKCEIKKAAGFTVAPTVCRPVLAATCEPPDDGDDDDNGGGGGGGGDTPTPDAKAQAQALIENYEFYGVSYNTTTEASSEYLVRFCGQNWWRRDTYSGQVSASDTYGSGTWSIKSAIQGTHNNYTYYEAAVIASGVYDNQPVTDQQVTVDVSPETAQSYIDGVEYQRRALTGSC